MDYYRGIKVPSKYAQEFLFFSTCLGHLKDQSFKVDRNSFNDNLIMYVLSGKLHVEQEGHHILSKGQGIIMRLSDRHKYYTDPQDICEILWIHFNGRQSEFYLKHIEDFYQMPAIFNDDKIPDLIRQCFSIYDAKDSRTEFEISEIIYSLLMTVMHAVTVLQESLDISPKIEFMNKAISYINDNIYSKITLEQLSSHFNLSQYHFCRLFSKYFKMTPMTYVLMKKMELSKYMLTYTGDSVSSISNSLGFSDQSHFTKTFQKYNGLTPRIYRKQ